MNSVKFRSGSGSGYNLLIDDCKVMFYMLTMLMKYSFVPKNFSEFLFQDQDSTKKINNKSCALYFKHTH